MLTLPEILIQRRQELLEFFEWRFGTRRFTKALVFTSGLSAHTIYRFRQSAVSYDALQTIEETALHLGFRPGRMVCRSGKFTKPKSLKLPRWSDPACRIRFYVWQKDVRAKAENV